MNVIATRALIPTITSALMGGNAASQETFPLRSATITVPVAPGGGTDTVARLLARSLSEQWRHRNELQPAIPDSDVFKQFIRRDAARTEDVIQRA